MLYPFSSQDISRADGPDHLEMSNNEKVRCRDELFCVFVSNLPKISFLGI